MIRIMSAIRIMSISDDVAATASARRRLLDLVFRAEVMDLLPRRGEIDLDREFVADLTATLNRAGIARATRAGASDPLDEAAAGTLWRALDESPYPAGEWPGIREYLDDELLARLVGISPSSLRRYASGTRETPDGVAWRLHGLGRIVAALIGSYNAYGVRRWFERARAQLDGRTPAQVLAAATSEDDPELAAVVRLAEALVGPSLAA
jgi:hypothetical protein